MNERSAPQGASPPLHAAIISERGDGEHTVLKDAHARATWIREQLGDGDVETALIALDDLAWDLWTAVERVESPS